MVRKQSPCGVQPSEALGACFRAQHRAVLGVRAGKRACPSAAIHLLDQGVVCHSVSTDCGFVCARVCTCFCYQSHHVLLCCVLDGPSSGHDKMFLVSLQCGRASLPRPSVCVARLVCHRQPVRVFCWKPVSFRQCVLQCCILICPSAPCPELECLHSTVVERDFL